MKRNHLTLLFLFLTSFIYAQEPFITVWQPTNDWDIAIPIVYDVNNNYTIDFGDGTVLTNQTGPCYHVYEELEAVIPYTVTISGTFGRIDFSTIEEYEAAEIMYIQQWGDIQWTSMENAFHGCNSLGVLATDAPDLSQVTSMEGMFYGVLLDFTPTGVSNWDVSNVTNMKNLFKQAYFNNQSYISFDTWDVSNVTNMEGMFSDIQEFNKPLNTWDVSNVTNMSNMFGNTAFNQPLNNWDVSNVTDMSKMFAGAPFNQQIDSWDVSSVTNMSSMFIFSDFNQPLNNWNVSNVTDMSNVFNHSVFNQPLNNWDVSSVTNMSSMFKDCIFNQPLDVWDVSNVTDMSSIFEHNLDFNQPLNDWDVSNVTNMSKMFFQTILFDQPINSWDVSNVTDMSEMFRGTNFNQPIVNWDVSAVTTMSYMFYWAGSFNQPLNNWDVSSVIDMSSMFEYSIVFNQPLNNWDVSNVANMGDMFGSAYEFNQDLTDWDFSGITFDLKGFVDSTAISTENYDALLYWFVQQEIEEQFMYAYGLHYCDFDLREHMTYNMGWTILLDTLGEECQGNTINGTVLFDEDNNGCDSSDIAMVNFLVKANNDAFSYATTVGADGQYELKTFAETNYEIEVLGIPDYYTIVPETSSVSFTGYGNTEEVAFCVSSNEVIQDLSILILPVNEARPGFESEYQLVVENLGIQSIPTVTVSFEYNDAMQSFVSAVPAASSNSENVLTFTLADFQPFESRTIDITMQTFTPPTVNGDDVLNFTATVAPNQNDYTPQDNTFDVAQVVVNSFDPNDKRVVQGSEIYPEQTDEYLDYIIRFQNTGTASAINIRVKDVLSDEVDWNTLRPVSSSHEYRLEITDGNQVEFIFENINLPFEGEDEAGSNGFIAYKIKPVAGLEVGDIIHGNEVNIYFDYNLPIITNSVTTEIVSLMGVNDYALTGSIVLYPNPANDVLHLKSENNVAAEMVAIYNLQGRELMSFNQNMENMNISGLSAGVYLITVKTSQGSAQYKLIKE